MTLLCEDRQRRLFTTAGLGHDMRGCNRGQVIYPWCPGGAARQRRASSSSGDGRHCRHQRRQRQQGWQLYSCDGGAACKVLLAGARCPVQAVAGPQCRQYRRPTGQGMYSVVRSCAAMLYVGLPIVQSTLQLQRMRVPRTHNGLQGSQ